MSVISVSNLSKFYRLGTIGGGTIREDFGRWWAKVRGRPDPSLKIGQEKDSRQHGEEFWALRDVSFEVQQGEILGIIGSNGAGKSTLLKILSRVTAPTSGELRVKGRIASLLEVGTGFHPELTGRENVFLNGAILGMSKAEIRSKFDEIVAFSGVEAFIDTPVKRYSSGMYVRLAFAVAAHLEPEILIVDEVLAVGDAEFQKKCLGKMGDVAAQGRTVLFVSHNLVAVGRLCQRCLMMADGQICGNGATQVIIGQYCNRYQATTLQNLRARTDRSGKGTVRIVDLSIHCQNDSSTITQVRVDEQVAFQLDIESSRSTTLWVGITIWDTTGRKVIHSSNRLQGMPPLPISLGYVSLTISFPNFGLGEGSYVVTASVFDAVSMELEDEIDAAASMTVVAEDIYGSGFPFTSAFGDTHLRHKWEYGKAQLKQESCND